MRNSAGAGLGGRSAPAKRTPAAPQT